MKKITINNNMHYSITEASLSEIKADKRYSTLINKFWDSNGAAKQGADFKQFNNELYSFNNKIMQQYNSIAYTSNYENESNKRLEKIIDQTLKDYHVKLQQLGVSETYLNKLTASQRSLLLDRANALYELTPDYDAYKFITKEYKTFYSFGIKDEQLDDSMLGIPFVPTYKTYNKKGTGEFITAPCKVSIFCNTLAENICIATAVWFNKNTDDSCKRHIRDEDNLFTIVCRSYEQYVDAILSDKEVLRDFQYEAEDILD